MKTLYSTNFLGRLLSIVTCAGLSLMACQNKTSSEAETPAVAASATDTKATDAKATDAKATDTPAAKAEEGVAVSDAATKQGQEIFQQRCVVCHGASGKGDGAASKGLNPPPRNWTDTEWQKVAKDEEIAKAIVGGGQAVGKSMLMPPNPDLADKPEVVQALVQIVRSFSGK